MANIEDYLTWRADVPFSVDPFNEVDALILCELVYSPFDGIVPGPGHKVKLSIEEVCQSFFEKYNEEELLSTTASTRVAPFLMRKMINTNRFGGTKLAGFVNDIDIESQSQFSCCCFYLKDGTVFVAFRGTDDTLVGWKEDFNLCFSSGTGGQLKAVEYLNNYLARTMRPIRVGGHSKGGNFAVYSCAFSKPHIKDNLIEIYNFDGPGFIEEILEDPKYKSIIKRTHKFIPKESIIGMLMHSKAKTKIVSSEEKGIYQHNIMNWKVERNHLIYEDSLATNSVTIDKTIKKWAGQFDYETRELFGEVFFASLLTSSGASNLSELSSKKIKSIASLTKEVQSLDEQNQVLIMDVIKRLALAGGESFKNSIISKFTKNEIVRKEEKKRDKKSNE